MNKKLYVGNLPFGADEASIRSLFEGEGFQVASVKIMMDRETGRSRGFGFAELTTPEDAVKAAGHFNGFQFMGRPLIVNEAQDRPPRVGGFGGPRPGGFTPSGGTSGLPRPNGPGGPPPRVGGFNGGGDRGPRPGGFNGGGGFSGGGFGGGYPPPFDPASDPNAGGAPRGRDHNRGKDRDRKKRDRGDW